MSTDDREALPAENFGRADVCEHGSLRRSCMRCEMAEQVADLTRQLSEVTKERDALRSDAERYRWLRGKPSAVPSVGLDVATWNDYEGSGIRGADLDAAVDAEIAAPQPAEAKETPPVTDQPKETN